MEALAAVSIFLLTVWDMVKMYEKDEGGQYPFTEIKSVRVEGKRKGEGI
jgi:cyclic pyranopterin phosphate synthase